MYTSDYFKDYIVCVIMCANRKDNRIDRNSMQIILEMGIKPSEKELLKKAILHNELEVVKSVDVRRIGRMVSAYGPKDIVVYFLQKAKELNYGLFDMRRFHRIAINRKNADYLSVVNQYYPMNIECIRDNDIIYHHCSKCLD
jgi:hypothetical protein